MIYVVHNHDVVATFDDSYMTSLFEETEDIIVYDKRTKEVIAQFLEGEWSVVFEGEPNDGREFDKCGYLPEHGPGTDKHAACPRCNRSSQRPLSPTGITSDSQISQQRSSDSSQQPYRGPLDRLRGTPYRISGDTRTN